MENSKNPAVLVVEGDAENRAATARVLRNAGYDVRIANNGQEGLDQIKEGGIDIVITDFRLPEIDGVELLKTAKSVQSGTEVILITGSGTIEAAVEAIKEGAYDFISKPITHPGLLRVVERAAQKRRLARQNGRFPSPLDEKGGRQLIYDSPQMHQIARTLEQVAPTSAAVLITGENGCGKELLAEVIHARSQRRYRPLIKLNCAALPEPVLLAELFGCESDATSRRKGRLDVANGGTLFLDEIAASGLALQARLLRLLERGRFERVQGTKSVNADVRIVAATNRDLYREVREGRFREDFFCRLNSINIRVPSLRERKDDILPLSLHFLRAYAEKNNKVIDGFSDAAILALHSHHWPGNVDELQKTIERSVVLTNSSLISSTLLRDEVSTPATSGNSLSLKIGTPLHECQRRAIEFALQHTRGDKNVAARLLGIATRTIYRHIERRRRDERIAGDKNPLCA